MSFGWIIFLCAWGFIGMIVGASIIDGLGKTSKKQEVFLCVVFGPVAWLFGFIALTVFSVQKLWKMLE